uniref:Rab-GAP TBC domain-containing protein n=1 Tax=Strongyloides venezuelensis TaxID=75913 RepID=A0A0K0EUW1_STRVS
MYLKKDKKNFDGYQYQNSGYIVDNYQKNGEQQYLNNHTDSRIYEVDDSFNDINSLLHSHNNNSFYDKSQYLHPNNNKTSYYKTPKFSQTQENYQHSLPYSDNSLNSSYYETPYLNSQHQQPQNISSSFYSSNHQYNPKQLFNNEDYQSPNNTNYSYPYHQTIASPVSERIPLSTSVDTSCLDDLLVNSDMSKSSSQWKSSFNGIREKYSNGYFNDSYNDGKHYSSTSYSLPRRNETPNYLMKSNSYHTISTPRKVDDNKGLLQTAVERRIYESPEISSSLPNHVRRPGTDMGTFWLNTIRKSPAKQVLTASERLEKLQEPAHVNSYHGGNEKVIKRTFISNTLPIKRSDNHSVASRKAIFSSPTSNDMMSSRTSSLNHKIISTPHIDISDLEDAVAQLTTKNERHINNFDSNSSSKALPSSLSAGLHRFPTGEEYSHHYNHYNNINTNNKSYTTNKYLSVLHSPSPDSGTDNSQSCPTDLPHPKPKHNLREQIINASIQSTPFVNEKQISPSRMIFPITNTGQVANKISTYEKKHSSPTPPNLLQLASQLNGNGMYPSNIDETSRSTSSSPCRSPVALSPKSSVFRTKPIIQFGVNSYSSSSSNSSSTSPCTVNYQISTPSINGFQNNNVTKSYITNTYNNHHKNQEPSSIYNIYHQVSSIIEKFLKIKTKKEKLSLILSVLT